MMNFFGIFAGICGILLGVSLTFQIERIMRNRSVPSLSNIGAVSTNDSSAANQDSTKLPVDSGKVPALQREKLRLEEQLRIIEQKLTEAMQQGAAALLVRSEGSKDQQRRPKEKTAITSAPRPTTKDVSYSAASTLNGYQLAQNSCPYNFKVFVYDLPISLPSVAIGEQARKNGTLHVCQKCILEQFSLEYIVNDYFAQFCGRTYNAAEADFFYLPLVRDAEFRVAMSQKGRNRAPSETEQALLQIIERNDSTLWRSVFKVTDKYWHRKGGADHIIVMPAPVTNLRHESSQRGFFHYMPHLHTPIFLCLEYSRDFVREYPICATRKNIVMPYPTTDPDLYSGRLFASHITRAYLLYYAGGMHGDCIQVRAGHEVTYDEQHQHHRHCTAYPLGTG